MGPASTRKAAPLPPGVGQVVHGPSLLSDQDVYLFREGNQFRLFDKLGAHVLEVDGRRGTHFAVWAPNAKRVSVIGNFNGWSAKAHPLAVRWDGSGIWEGFVPGPTEGELYKYHIESNVRRYKVDKGDPMAYLWEGPPRTASVVWDLGYRWQDGEWMAGRGGSAADDAPMSVYEVHLGSWRRVPDEGHRSLSYREMAVQLVDYVREMGFTHVELLPVLEHPFGGSWGYQAIGYFAPTSRFGTPQDLMFLIDSLHRAGIGVILDWVPSHFPYDEHGLGFFDGTHLYEHQDPRKGFHPDWKSAIFNYGRNEVRSFLVSSALFWLEKFHFDGLRVDAVASMLYLDYSRKDGEWIPNEYGGRENLEAIAFLKRLNEAVYGAHPDIQTVAEESTAWPMVTRPVYLGGLGFGRKWNMGWMHDTLEYFSKDPVHRKFHQDKLTFNLWYAFTENFILPLSHDEVVHGKGSLVGRMPGDDWQKFANLRLLLGLQFANPGKQLLFMGSEFGQRSEWSHDGSLEWHLLRYEPHAGLQRWVKDLNRLSRAEPALHELDFSPTGFEWVDFGDRDNSVVSFLRIGRAAADTLLVVCNMTPVPRPHYRVGAPAGGFWRELLNSDADLYGGSGQGNLGGLEAGPVPCHGRGNSLALNLPPLGILFLKAS